MKKLLFRFGCLFLTIGILFRVLGYAGVIDLQSIYSNGQEAATVNGIADATNIRLAASGQQDGGAAGIVALVGAVLALLGLLASCAGCDSEGSVDSEQPVN